MTGAPFCHAYAEMRIENSALLPLKVGSLKDMANLCVMLGRYQRYDLLLYLGLF